LAIDRLSVFATLYLYSSIILTSDYKIGGKMKGVACVVLVLFAALASAQIPEWIHQYPGYGSSGARDIAVDDAGNVYVAGWGAFPNRSRDCLTIKYNSIGDTLWVRYYDGGANFYDDGFALALNDAGDVYVTGRSIASGSDYDIVTIKYNSGGVEQWVARYNGIGDDDDEGYDIAIDDAGHIYVVGFSNLVGNRDHYITIKYNNYGDTLWTAMYGGPDSVGCRAHAIDLDDSGNAYVTGEGYASASFRDIVTVKYDSSGNEEWVASYNGLTTYADDAAYDVVYHNGFLYVTGESENANYDADYLTIKYNDSGDTVWTARYNGPGNSDDEARALAVDNSGAIYVTGESSGSGSSSDYATIKYTSAGTAEWTSRYNGPDNLGDEANAIAIDDMGNVYVTGRSYATAPYTPENDYLTVKYDASGNEQWAARYDGTGHTQDEAHAIAVDNAGYVYITGESTGNTSYEDVVTIKYATTGITEDTELKIEDARYKMTVSPNPFNHQTQIRFMIQDSRSTIENMRIRIFDASGRIVKSFDLSSSIENQRSSIIWNGRDDHGRELSSGVYFIQLDTGDHKEVEQVLLIR
jgi:hypothetical protein